eukprot:gene771-1245_t
MAQLDLMVGRNYVLKLTSYLTGNPTVRDTESLSFVMDSLPLVLVITGGDVVTGSANVLTLSTASSVDPDGEAGPIMYSWSCRRDDGRDACRYQDGALLPLAMRNETIQFTLLGDINGVNYTFSCEGTKGSRTSTTSTRLSIFSGAPPVVVMTPFTSKSNPTSRLSLSAEVTSADPATLQMQWSVACVTDPAQQLVLNATTLSTPLDSEALVVRAGVLTPGFTYSFTLSAWDRIGPASATLSVTMNTCPSLAHGTGISVLTTNGTTVGTELETVFTISASGWTDDDLPLQYQMLYRVVGGATSVYTPLINDFTTLASPYQADGWGWGKVEGERRDWYQVSVKMPEAGLAAHQYLVSVRVSVIDSYSALSSADTNITVLEAATVDTDALLSQSKEMLRNGDSNSAMVFAKGLSSALNVAGYAEYHDRNSSKWYYNATDGYYYLYNGTQAPSGETPVMAPGLSRRLQCVFPEVEVCYKLFRDAVARMTMMVWRTEAVGGGARVCALPSILRPQVFLGSLCHCAAEGGKALRGIELLQGMHAEGMVVRRRLLAAPPRVVLRRRLLTDAAGNELDEAQKIRQRRELMSVVQDTTAMLYPSTAMTEAMAAATTDVCGIVEELDEDTQNAAMGNMARLVTGSQDPNRETRMSDVSKQSVADGLSNLNEAAVANDTLVADEASANRTAEVMSIMQSLGSSLLLDAVDGEDPAEVTAATLAMSTQRSRSDLENSPLYTAPLSSPGTDGSSASFPASLGKVLAGIPAADCNATARNTTNCTAVALPKRSVSTRILVTATDAHYSLVGYSNDSDSDAAGHNTRDGEALDLDSEGDARNGCYEEWGAVFPEWNGTDAGYRKYGKWTFDADGNSIWMLAAAPFMRLPHCLVNVSRADLAWEEEEEIPQVRPYGSGLYSFRNVGGIWTWSMFEEDLIKGVQKTSERAARLNRAAMKTARDRYKNMIDRRLTTSSVCERGGALGFPYIGVEDKEDLTQANIPSWFFSQDKSRLYIEEEEDNPPGGYPSHGARTPSRLPSTAVGGSEYKDGGGRPVKHRILHLGPPPDAVQERYHIMHRLLLEQEQLSEHEGVGEVGALDTAEEPDVDCNWSSSDEEDGGNVCAADALPDSRSPGAHGSDHGFSVARNATQARHPALQESACAKEEDHVASQAGTHEALQAALPPPLLQPPDTGSGLCMIDEDSLPVDPCAQRTEAHAERAGVLRGDMEHIPVVKQQRCMDVDQGADRKHFREDSDGAIMLLNETTEDIEPTLQRVRKREMEMRRQFHHLERSSAMAGQLGLLGHTLLNNFEAQRADEIRFIIRPQGRPLTVLDEVDQLLSAEAGAPSRRVPVRVRRRMVLKLKCFARFVEIVEHSQDMHSTERLCGLIDHSLTILHRSIPLNELRQCARRHTCTHGRATKPTKDWGQLRKSIMKTTKDNLLPFMKRQTERCESNKLERIDMLHAFKSTGALDRSKDLKLPMERMLGTALMLAWLEVRAIVPREQLQAQLEMSKLVLITMNSAGWYLRSVMWNLVLLQSHNGSYDICQGVATLLHAGDTSHYLETDPNYELDVDVLVDSVPETLTACEPIPIDVKTKVWATICCIERYRLLPFEWVVNPRELPSERRTLEQIATMYLNRQKVEWPQVGAVMEQLCQDAKKQVTKWRDDHLEAITALRQKVDEDKELTRAGMSEIEQTRERREGLRRELWTLWQSHPFMQIAAVGPTAPFTRAQQLLVLVNGFLFMLMVELWLEWSRASLCCTAFKTYLGCTPATADSECWGYTTCFELYEARDDEVLPQFLQAEEYTCVEFPRAGVIMDMVYKALITVGISLLVNLALSALFTIGGTPSVLKFLAPAKRGMVSKMLGSSRLENTFYFLFTVILDFTWLARILARYFLMLANFCDAIYVHLREAWKTVADQIRRARRTLWFMLQVFIYRRDTAVVLQGMEVNLKKEAEEAVERLVLAATVTVARAELDSLFVQTCYILMTLTWALVIWFQLVYAVQLRSLEGPASEHRVINGWLLAVILENCGLAVFKTMILNYSIYKAIIYFEASAKGELGVTGWYERFTT